MSEDGPEAASSAENSPDGVFGNLPSTRPGSRSPRRRGSEEEAQAPEADEVAAEPVNEAPPEPHVEEPEVEPEPPAREPEPVGTPKSVEDLAWAGVAVVAHAATAGIRFTSKALEAARKSIDRP